MAILVDTNILLRLAQPHHPHAAIALRALRALRSNGEILHIVQQNLVEFWAVATRPLDANGLGYTVEQARNELAALKRIFNLLPELPLHDEWERIVTAFGVSGKSVHDARLVAAMRVHEIDRILTFNTQDFERYAEIQVLDAKKLG